MTKIMQTSIIEEVLEDVHEDKREGLIPDLYEAHYLLVTFVLSRQLKV